MEKIRFDKLTFTYPLCEEPALKDISFQINSSEFIVVCGKSGCGKSTLLRHMKKSMIPYGKQTGQVTYEGRKMEELDDRRSASEIGFVQQNPDHQIVTDKVWHELAFGLENLGLPVKVIKRRVAEMASYFGIQNWFHRDVHQLSGGQKQIVNLASVMAMQPEVLILDEPTSQLDPIAASDFLQTINRINKDLGTTVIISEHRLEEVFPMADRVMVMDQGKIEAFENPAKTGAVLSGGSSGVAHPMFYGLPCVMRIFQPILSEEEESPITIREGRMKMEELMEQAHCRIQEEKKEKNRFRERMNYKKESKRLDGRRRGDKKEAAVFLKDVWFRYGRDLPDILKGLSFEVRKGEWYCLLGGNGTGKSTVLKAICGILKPQRGTVCIDGIQVEKGAEQKLFDHRLAMVPQNPQALFTEITAEEELYEGIRFLDMPEEEKLESVERMLKLMEITHLRKANPYDLSGGEQQRLAIGKILLLDPTVLLLDEPTKGLDPFFKRTLAEILSKLRDQGVTIFMVSHDLDFCASYGDRCAMFFDGEIVSEAPPADFFPGNHFYTTTANKIVRKWNPELITCEEVQRWLQEMI